MKGDRGKESFQELIDWLKREYMERMAWVGEYDMEGLSELFCEGICGTRAFRSWEKGNRALDWEVRKRIVERLGIGMKDYESFVGYEQYRKWKAKMKLLDSIVRGEGTIELLREYKSIFVKTLEQYEGELSATDRIEAQFCLSMEARIRQGQGAAKEELEKLYGEALALTVQGVEEKPLIKRLLCVKEINLILETEYWRREGERRERYLEIIKYIEQSGWDRWNRALLYPKAVYFLCRCVMAGKVGMDGEWGLPELCRYCERAAELLRESQRMYFLWEILDMLEKIQHKMIGIFTSRKERHRAEPLRLQYLQVSQWKRCLGGLYQEFAISKETRDDCFLYVEKGVFCYNDVIRVRRNMLGMSQEELCEGICSIRTLKRLERNQHNTHEDIVKEMFERLGLPRELVRTELATGRPHVRRRMAEIRKLTRQRQWDKAEGLLKQVREQLDMGLVCNQQAMTQNEVLIAWGQGKLDDTAFGRQMKGALELTLPYEALFTEGEKYLTYEEQICLMNMMLTMDEQGEEYLACMKRLEEIYHPLIEEGLYATVAAMYEFVMGNVSSSWGNRGNLDLADQYNEIILRGCLRYRRVESIEECLYGRWWNHAERIKNGIPTNIKLDGERELRRCITLCEYSRQDVNAAFCKNKLEQLSGKEGLT